VQNSCFTWNGQFALIVSRETGGDGFFRPEGESFSLACENRQTFGPDLSELVVASNHPTNPLADGSRLNDDAGHY
jgi:hypothetical protein